MPSKKAVVGAILAQGPWQLWVSVTFGWDPSAFVRAYAVMKMEKQLDASVNRARRLLHLAETGNQNGWSHGPRPTIYGGLEVGNSGTWANCQMVVKPGPGMSAGYLATTFLDAWSESFNQLHQKGDFWVADKPPAGIGRRCVNYFLKENSKWRIDNLYAYL